MADLGTTTTTKPVLPPRRALPSAVPARRRATSKVSKRTPSASPIRGREPSPKPSPRKSEERSGSRSRSPSEERGRTRTPRTPLKLKEAKTYTVTNDIEAPKRRAKRERSSSSEEGEEKVEFEPNMTKEHQNIKQYFKNLIGAECEKRRVEKGGRKEKKTSKFERAREACVQVSLVARHYIYLTRNDNQYKSSFELMDEIAKVVVSRSYKFNTRGLGKGPENEQNPAHYYKEADVFDWALYADTKMTLPDLVEREEEEEKEKGKGTVRPAISRQVVTITAADVATALLTLNKDIFYEDNAKKNSAAEDFLYFMDEIFRTVWENLTVKQRKAMIETRTKDKTLGPNGLVRVEKGTRAGRPAENYDEEWDDFTQEEKEDLLDKREKEKEKEMGKEFRFPGGNVDAVWKKLTLVEKRKVLGKPEPKKKATGRRIIRRTNPTIIQRTRQKTGERSEEKSEEK